MRISLYAGPAVQAVLNAPTDTGEETRSGRIGTVCRRYMRIIRDEVSRLQFTQAEWMAIIDAGQIGPREDEDGGEARGEDGVYLWASIQDSRDQDERFGVDHLAIARRVQALSVAGRMALIEVLRHAWVVVEYTEDSDTVPLETRLERFGVKFAAQGCVP